MSEREEKKEREREREREEERERERKMMLFERANVARMYANEGNSRRNYARRITRSHMRDYSYFAA